MIFNKCQYKDVLGKPNEGVHSYRVANIAIIDVIMTILGALFISYTFLVSFWKTLGSLFVSGIVLHRLFCVRTTIDKLLFS
jgi:hypothetical protein